MIFEDIKLEPFYKSRLIPDQKPRDKQVTIKNVNLSENIKERNMMELFWKFCILIENHRI